MAHNVSIWNTAHYGINMANAFADARVAYTKAIAQSGATYIIFFCPQDNLHLFVCRAPALATGGLSFFLYIQLGVIIFTSPIARSQRMRDSHLLP
jgi:hypothetical protein